MKNTEKVTIKDIIGNTHECIIRGFIPFQKKSEIEKNEPLKIKKYKETLKANYELSANEEMVLYYESYEKKKQYDTLRLFYKFYFYEAYEALNSGIDFMHFIHTEKKKPLLLKQYNALLDEMVLFFTEKYGEPQIEVEDKEPFKKNKYWWNFSINDINTVLVIRDEMDETEKFSAQDYAQILTVIVGAE